MYCITVVIDIIMAMQHYQTEETFEEKKPFMKLMKTNLSKWPELWEPVVVDIEESAWVVKISGGNWVRAIKS